MDRIETVTMILTGLLISVPTFLVGAAGVFLISPASILARPDVYWRIGFLWIGIMVFIHLLWFGFCWKMGWVIRIYERLMK